MRGDGLVFPSGTRYEYSNTDNIIVGLIAEQVTGEDYGDLLAQRVFGPAGLSRTSFPTRRISLPRPFIRGYATAPGEEPEDLTTFLSPSGAWASGAIVSTPLDVGAFMRAYLARRYFGAAQQREQFRFVRGSSSPPGPGANAAGLAIFRYRSRCGTVFGHTGNIPGYVQWAAATRGRQAVRDHVAQHPRPAGEAARAAAVGAGAGRLRAAGPLAPPGQYPGGGGGGCCRPLRRLNSSTSEITKAIAPTTIRITPTVWMSMPATVAVTANRRIAPTAIRKSPKPMVIVRAFSTASGIPALTRAG